MSEDWRKKYLQLADEHEREEARHAAAERDLSRLITRLCVAVSGLDATLDPHLERLRRAAKGGKSATLLRNADELADALVHASEDRARPGVLQRLFERAELGRRQTDEALRAWADVAADPAAASDAALDRLGGLLQPAIVTAPGDAAAAPGDGGLLDRIIGRRAGGAPSANRLLSDLLEQVGWPEGLRADIDACRAKLAADAADDAWTDVVRDVSEIAVRALAEAQANAAAAERFLADLGRRLEALDRHMLDEAARGEASRASGERLERQMTDEVERLSDDVRQSADLAQLQASVLASLDRMQAHVREHIEDENKRRADAEAEAETLRDQMRTLERDTFDLRRQVAQTQEQALRDALTGLPNRRAYDERVAQELARLRRFGDPLALLVLDVDDFKQINDTHGHKAGDKALAMIAKILRERLRATDFIARFGGEEFVLLLPGAEQDAAVRVADAMRLAVEQGGLHAGGQPVRVTVSGGLSLFGDGDTAEGVFERADKALYDAKRQGKNRVNVA
ncbi:MAG: GGDEF domain-containing protein [Gammaproteobacteria bacterium]|nr:GGDEF domain-containing protein [Gammaproteobacteria bacterium]